MELRCLINSKGEVASGSDCQVASMMFEGLARARSIKLLAFHDPKKKNSKLRLSRGEWKWKLMLEAFPQCEMFRGLLTHYVDRVLEKCWQMIKTLFRHQTTTTTPGVLQKENVTNSMFWWPRESTDVGHSSSARENKTSTSRDGEKLSNNDAPFMWTEAYQRLPSSLISLLA